MFKNIFILATLIAIFHCSSLRTLSSSDFDTVLSENSKVIVFFFSPGCGHCTKFRPEYEKLPEMLEEENIVVAEVNCVDNVEVCEQENIEGYPTINLYDNKFKVNYNEERTADAVIKWIQKYNNAKINIITKE